MQGTFSEKHVCDPSCTSARGPVCVCACGGANHSIAWLGLPTWHLTFNGKVVESTPEAIAAVKAAKAAKAAAKVADRNAKYAAYRAQRDNAPASDAQKGFVDSLLAQRDVPAEAGAIDVLALTKPEASSLIEWLLTLPRKPVVVTLPGKADTLTAPKVTVPNGRYALTPAGETQAKFYRVNSPDKGTWKGYTFVSEIVGGGLGGWGAQRNIRGAAADAVLASIATDPQKAMADFGHLTNHCGKCKALLTDEVSVANGIGPVCIKTLGWTPRA